MKCLKDFTITRYIDNGFPGKKAQKINRHLAGCSRCRERAKEIKDEIDFVNKETERFNPLTIPEPQDTFVLPRPDAEKKRFADYFTLKWPVFDLRPVRVAVPLVLSVVCLLIVLLSVTGSNTGPDIKNETGSRAVIRYVGIGGQPVNAYVVEEAETNTTFVWVEKK